MDNGRPHKEVAKGLNSHDLRKNPNIPYADDIVELYNIETKPVQQNQDEVSHIEDTESLSNLQNNPNLPYVDDDDVDDIDELNNIRTEPVPRNIDDESDNEETEPLIPRKDGKIHATDLGSVRSSPNSDTIVVNTPEGTLYITLDPDSSRPSTSSLKSPSTKSTNTATPTTSKVIGAFESKDLITVERGEEVTSVEQRKASLRRNSISMPTLSEIDLIRQQYTQSKQNGVSDFIVNYMYLFIDTIDRTICVEATFWQQRRFLIMSSH